jgi:hypothetical protein
MRMVAQIGETVLRQRLSQSVMNRQAAKSGIEDADVKMYQRKFSTSSLCFGPSRLISNN